MDEAGSKAGEQLLAVRALIEDVAKAIADADGGHETVMAHHRRRAEAAVAKIFQWKTSAEYAGVMYVEDFDALKRRVDELLSSNNALEARAREAERRLTTYRANHFTMFEEMTTCFNLVRYLEQQREWSIKTFGPAGRSNGCIKHIRKELIEIEEAKNPELRFKEWIDVIILGFDGAWREGFDVPGICFGLVEKLAINKRRSWPDWREVEPGEPIEHIG